MTQISIAALNGQPSQEEMQRLAVYFNSQMELKNYAVARSTLQRLLFSAQGELIPYLYYVLAAIPSTISTPRHSKQSAMASSTRPMTYSGLNRTRRNQPSNSLSCMADDNGRLNLNYYTARIPAEPRTAQFSYTSQDRSYVYYYQALKPANIPTQPPSTFAYQAVYAYVIGNQQIYSYICAQPTMYQAFPGIQNGFPAIQSTYCVNPMSEVQYTQATLPRNAYVTAAAQYRVQPQFSARDQYSSNIEQDYADEQILQEILGDQYAYIKQLQTYEVRLPQPLQSYTPPRQAPPELVYRYTQPPAQPYSDNQREQLDIKHFASYQLSKIELPQINMQQLIDQAGRCRLFNVIEQIMTFLLQNYQFAATLLALCYQVSGTRVYCSDYRVAIRGCLNYIKVHCSGEIIDYLAGFVKQQCGELISRACQHLYAFYFAEQHTILSAADFISRFALIKLMVVQ